MSSGFINTVVVSDRRPLIDYVQSIVILFNQGFDKIAIIGKGQNIARAVTVVNILRDKLGDSLSIDNIEIGSLKERSKRISYIKIIVSRQLF